MADEPSLTGGDGFTGGGWSGSGWGDPAPELNVPITAKIKGIDSTTKEIQALAKAVQQAVASFKEFGKVDMSHLVNMGQTAKTVWQSLKSTFDDGKAKSKGTGGKGDAPDGAIRLNPRTGSAQGDSTDSTGSGGKPTTPVTATLLPMSTTAGGPGPGPSSTPTGDAAGQPGISSDYSIGNALSGLGKDSGSGLGGLVSKLIDAINIPIKYTHDRVEENRSVARGMSDKLGAVGTLSGRTIENLIAELGAKTPVYGTVPAIVQTLQYGSKAGYSLAQGNEARAGAFYENIRQQQMLAPGESPDILAQKNISYLRDTRTQQRAMLLTGGALSSFGPGAVPKTLQEWAESILKFLEGQRPGRDRGKPFSKQELQTQYFPGSNINAWFASIGVPDYMQDFFWQYAIGKANVLEPRPDGGDKGGTGLFSRVMGGLAGIAQAVIPGSAGIPLAMGIAGALGGRGGGGSGVSMNDIANVRGEDLTTASLMRQTATSRREFDLTGSGPGLPGILGKLINPSAWFTGTQNSMYRQYVRREKSDLDFQGFLRGIDKTLANLINGQFGGLIADTPTPIAEAMYNLEQTALPGIAGSLTNGLLQLIPGLSALAGDVPMYGSQEVSEPKVGDTKPGVIPLGDAIYSSKGHAKRAKTSVTHKHLESPKKVGDVPFQDYGSGWGSYGGTGFIGMDPSFASRLGAMMADNPNIQITSGYRDGGTQERLYNAGMPNVAPPGQSYHAKGVAADLGPSSEFDWIAANAHKYGLENAAHLGEPWHVGAPGTVPSGSFFSFDDVAADYSANYGDVPMHVTSTSPLRNVDLSHQIGDPLSDMASGLQSGLTDALSGNLGSLFGGGGPFDLKSLLGSVKSGFGNLIGLPDFGSLLGGQGKLGGLFKGLAGFLTSGGNNGGQLNVQQQSGLSTFYGTGPDLSGAYNGGGAGSPGGMAPPTPGIDRPGPKRNQPYRTPSPGGGADQGRPGNVGAHQGKFPDATPEGPSAIDAALRQGRLSPILYRMFRAYNLGGRPQPAEIPTGDTLRVVQTLDSLKRAGFKDDGLITMASIGWRESRWRPDAHNVGPKDDSYGLFQINMQGALGAARRKQFGIQRNEQLYDPVVNAKAAYALSTQGKGFSPWRVNNNPLGGGAIKYAEPIYNIAKKYGYVGDPRKGGYLLAPGLTAEPKTAKNEFNTYVTVGGGSMGEAEARRVGGVIADTLESEMKQRLSRTY